MIYVILGSVLGVFLAKLGVGVLQSALAGFVLAMLLEGELT